MRLYTVDIYLEGGAVARTKATEIIQKSNGTLTWNYDSTYKPYLFLLQSKWLAVVVVDIEEVEDGPAE